MPLLPIQVTLAVLFLVGEGHSDRLVTIQTAQTHIPFFPDTVRHYELRYGQTVRDSASEVHIVGVLFGQSFENCEVEMIPVAKQLGSYIRGLYTVQQQRLPPVEVLKKCVVASQCWYMFYLPKIKWSTPMRFLTSSLARLTYSSDCCFKGVFSYYFSRGRSLPGPTVGYPTENRTTRPECLPKAEFRQLKTEKQLVAMLVLVLVQAFQASLSRRQSNLALQTQLPTWKKSSESANGHKEPVGSFTLYQVSSLSSDLTLQKWVAWSQSTMPILTEGSNSAWIEALILWMMLENRLLSIVLLVIYKAIRILTWSQDFLTYRGSVTLQSTTPCVISQPLAIRVGSSFSWGVYRWEQMLQQTVPFGSTLKKAFRYALHLRHLGGAVTRILGTCELPRGINHPP